MNRLIALLVVIAVAVVAVPIATSADDPLQSSLDDLAAWDPAFGALAATPPAGHQMAVGSLRYRLDEFDQGYEHFRISAHSGPAGEDPKGQVHITSTVAFAEIDAKANVICLDVVTAPPPFIGRTAFVWARFEEPHLGNQFVNLIIRDRGNPGDFGEVMGNSPDDVLRLYTNLAPPPNCAFFGSGFVAEKSGNMIVRDAP